ncbi:hypothetical protein NP233_g4283 [Leucocoprinus birnbaumii]|uniref:Aminoglycoside phosphotransferase domain-containing protein n=1 Tax=Leucocoprinus birnbaumii TaxID=56174 RepID=A0AAD5YXQ2_9AGAR|nr:hypothetical protein NP233_g4283 [Leucocoprinus birnbaumii]
MASTKDTTFDLTTEAGVEGYLAGTPYACSRVEALSGGTGNFAFRLYLHQPHEGVNTLVLKHSRPYIKNLKSIAFDIKRQSFEVEALRRVREWSPADAFVTVPTVYLYDDAEHVVIMSDCGANSVTLKEFMQQGRCSPDVAHRIGKEVGDFLGRLHLWGKENKEVHEFFDANEQAKQLSSWVFYGRLLATFDDKLEKLQDPEVKPSETERSALEKIAEESGDAMRKATGTFVMGDFWPGNLVLSFDEAGNVSQVSVLDWELCKPGIFGVELGQFCAELVLLMRFNTDVCGQDAKRLLEDFLTAYAGQVTPDLEMCRRAIVHLGTHLVTLTPRIEWGGKEKTQEVVKEGLGLILDGYSAEKEWLEKSVIAPLLMSVT